MTTQNSTTNLRLTADQYVNKYIELDAAITGFDQLLDNSPSDYCNDRVIEALHARLRSAYDDLLPVFTQTYLLMIDIAPEGSLSDSEAFSDNQLVNPRKTV